MKMDNDHHLGPYEEPLEQMITLRLSRVYAQLNAQASKILKETAGLSQVQWRVLVMLISVGPLAPHQIVRRLLMDKSQLSRTIKIMEKEGLLSVRESESDSRSSVLHITPKGRQLYEKALPRMRSRQSALNAQFTAKERRNFIEVLKRIEAATQDFEKETS
ncbi:MULTISPECIES: MarR family winged helix-turn-helix transcriptional regulator [unclassified Ruegeria]|uniref:MarR family winged helix-turn-helix transcriptional regulator n=1 Tax=unclassified Ruegeria TaxID=2625375 RepID=UPI001489E962|nr:MULTISPECIES: MarR family transcriptional regulator [unclassified Ruegeria]NOD95410.1 MarR family transcriptional regulator [Ruegeria sp. HKCCD4884]